MAETLPAETAPDPRRPPQLFVVGLGASAGGINALKDFFAHVPPATGAAYVVILHLSPDHDSRLAEVLQTSASMPVRQVSDTTVIEADHVYVVPPSRSLRMAQGTLVLSEVTRVEERRAPVDVFFRALAEAQGLRSACVVLSGTGQNGSAGLKRVKEHGGLAVAQDPAEAEYEDMPRNAIATGLVDCVLPVAEIPGRISTYIHRLKQADGPVPDAGSDESQALREVLTLLRVRTGHDFSGYKSATLHRRIQRRVQLRNQPSTAEYAKLMRENPDEAVGLMKEILISVTNFFRDAPAFDALAREVIPRIFQVKGPQDHVRAWVAGCATGEEAYSIAMLLAEHAAATMDAPQIQVFATDLDAHAISFAREGYYNDADVLDVPEERLARFFRREPRGYRVGRELRELVLFAHHNVAKDPPFSHLDLVSCRNLLIYLNRPVQERILETFHFALRPGGYLFLGGSESADGPDDLFVAMNKGARLYEARTVTTRPPTAIADTQLPLRRTTGRMVEGRPAPAERTSPAELHQRLLEQYSAPSAVVTEEHNVVHMSATVGRYLVVAGGEPSRDLVRMARPELRANLRSVLHQAARSGSMAEGTRVPVPLEDGVHNVTIRVKPALQHGEPARGFLLVIFEEDGLRPAGELTAPQQSVTGDTAARHLEEELSSLRQQLRSTTEQYETQVEEAKASNEELQALNEELRSAAEELETSREELQSVNEELTTVNQELKVKIEELRLANSDFQNLMNSTDIGTIFLDRELRVKMLTPAARTVFNLMRSDIGRPLSDIRSQLVDDRLHEDARAVLDRLHTIDREVETRDGRWHLMRLRPYRTVDDRIDGVVVTFQDISEKRNAESHVRMSEERLRLLIDSVVDYAIFTISEEGLIDSWNPGAERMFGYRGEEILGSRFEVLFTPEDCAAGAPSAELDRARRYGRAADERVHVRKNGVRFYCSGVTTRLGGRIGGFAKVARDLSGPRDAAEALRRANADVDAIVRERTGELEAEVHQHAAAQVQVLSLLRRIVTAQEDERARIARDLHDQLGQQLTALRLTLEQHKAHHDVQGDVREDVEHALAIAGQIDRAVDFLAWELRPAVLDDLGLAAALPRFVREWSAHYGIPAEYRARGFGQASVSREAEVVFYRVVQEGLNNVAKHAHASRVDVILEARDGSAFLVVEDDGVGFEPDSRETQEQGIGLIGMRERAALIGATLQIESSPGEGTSIFLRCPMCESDAAGPEE